MTACRILVALAVTLSLVLGVFAGCGKREEEVKQEPEAPPSEVAEMPEELAGVGERLDVIPDAEPGEGGSFYVESFPPAAEILINGEKAAVSTPHLFSNKMPGHYEVWVVLPGYVPEPDRMALDVAAGSLDTLSFTLEGEPLSSFALLEKAEKEVWPKWSPDGELIAFEGYYEHNRDIYVLPASGGEPRRLTFHEKADFSPCWSPDGKEIAFASARDGEIDIWAVSVDGGEPRRVTSSPGSKDGPTWSPDGKWIAYEAAGNIWKVPASGGEAQQITSGSERHFYASWSPDGKEIAFTARSATGRQLWVVNVATGAIRKLLADKGWSYAPSWSPDGRLIAFVRRGAPPARNHDLWVIPAKGGQITQLTLDPAPDQYPSWSPDGKKLVWTREGDLWVMMNLPDWLYESS